MIVASVPPTKIRGMLAAFLVQVDRKLKVTDRISNLMEELLFRAPPLNMKNGFTLDKLYPPQLTMEN